MIDVKDMVYLMGGLALLAFAALPLAIGRRAVSLPLIFVASGALLALLPVPWPNIDPRESHASLFSIEHLTELIVIISLAGAGLAVDRRSGWLEWQHSWVLLGAVMPLTVVALFVIGIWLGLDAASAVLLAAVLAPTDPVLAREVQVEGPNQSDEDDVQVSLTTEAGLNDGLAFPFVWLAIALSSGSGSDTWLQWLGMDVLWRIGAGLAAGWAVGTAVAKFNSGPWGDQQSDGANAGLILLGSTFLAYGFGELLDGYGFLSVFIAARAGRGYVRGTEDERYITKPHQYSDQFEKILLAALLLWLGGFAVSGALSELTWAEFTAAALLILVVRPVLAYIALLFTRGDRFERFTIALFGIRGMGSIFYLSFASGQADFTALDSLWRVVTVSVILSVVVHGSLAPLAVQRLRRMGH